MAAIDENSPFVKAARHVKSRLSPADIGEMSHDGKGHSRALRNLEHGLDSARVKYPEDYITNEAGLPVFTHLAIFGGLETLEALGSPEADGSDLEAWETLDALET